MLAEQRKRTKCKEVRMWVRWERAGAGPRPLGPDDVSSTGKLGPHMFSFKHLQPAFRWNTNINKTLDIGAKGLKSLRDFRKQKRLKETGVSGSVKISASDTRVSLKLHNQKMEMCRS